MATNPFRTLVPVLEIISGGARGGDHGIEVSQVVDLTRQATNPLRALVLGLEIIADGVRGGDHGIEVSQVVDITRRGGEFVVCFGNAFQLAKHEVMEKADKLERDSIARQCSNVRELVERDIREDSARVNSSSSRYLLRLKRGMDFASVFFQQILSQRESSTSCSFITAYNQVFRSYHNDIVIGVVLSLAESELPTKNQLFRNVNEDEDSANDLMRRFIAAANSVGQYLDGLFQSTETGRDLLRMI